MPSTFTTTTAGLIPGFMSLGLLGHSMGMIPKRFGQPMTPKQMKQQTKRFIGGSMGLLVGIPLTGAVAGQVAAL